MRWECTARLMNSYTGCFAKHQNALCTFEYSQKDAIEPVTMNNAQAVDRCNYHTNQTIKTTLNPYHRSRYTQFNRQVLAMGKFPLDMTMYPQPANRQNYHSCETSQISANLGAVCINDNTTPMEPRIRAGVKHLQTYTSDAKTDNARRLVSCVTLSLPLRRKLLQTNKFSLFGDIFLILQLLLFVEISLLLQNLLPIRILQCLFLFK